MLQEVESIIKNNTTSQVNLTQAFGVKGKTLLLMLRYNEAEESLLKAYDLAEEKQLKAGYANSLGVLYLKMHDKNKPEQFFRLASELVENDSILALKIRLNQMHAQPESADLTRLNEALSKISTVDSAHERVRYYLNLASIAKSHTSPAYSAVVKRALENAQIDSTTITDNQLRIEMLDSLAEFYESQKMNQQALELSELASSLAGQMDADDLMIQIEWRKGRIYQQQGRDNDALAAFGKAVDYVQILRRDIPVSYEDGRSSFRKTLEPIYLGYTHHLLKKANHQDGEAPRSMRSSATARWSRRS